MDMAYLLEFGRPTVIRFHSLCFGKPEKAAISFLYIELISAQELDVVSPSLTKILNMVISLFKKTWFKVHRLFH